ncbi:MAG TPA: cation transporter, partial [Saprospiraceae bacterium]|nr:cation transporter [Saprospiraceae bacterium]
MKQEDQIYLPLEDVNSEHCAILVDKELARTEGVINHKVELNNRRAVITAKDQDTVKKAIKSVKDIGYNVITVKKTFPLLGMSCASCAASAESIVKIEPGVVDAS